MSSSKPPIWLVLRAHFRADARKTGILVALAVVMVVVYARLYHKSGSPKEADAAVEPVASAVTAPPTGTLGATDKPRGTRPRVSLAEPLSTQLARNPFAIELDQFPLAEGFVESSSPEPTDLKGWDPDEDIREALRELILQSTICGAWPLACINGQFVRPGEEVAGFVVKRVEPTRVVLRRGNIEAALDLN